MTGEEKITITLTKCWGWLFKNKYHEKENVWWGKKLWVWNLLFWGLH